MTPDWSMTKDTASVDLPLGDLLAYGLALFPEKIAIADRRDTLSFAALEGLALAYAYKLQMDHGIGPGDRVLVLARKTCVIPAMAIALWKLGAVYMPVDADLPPLRLAGLAERAMPQLIVHFGGAVDLGGSNPAPLADFGGMIADCPADWVPPASHRHAAEDIAYVIHTSGSTGTPKGVQITERSLKAYFRAHNEMLRFGPHSRVFSLTPYHFDVSIEDTLLPLSLGAYVHLYSGIPQGDALRRALAQQEITHLIAVSTLLTIIADKPEAITRDAFPSLEMVMTGAELCAPSVINLWKSRLPSARVFNVYGPTEVTIVCTGYEITAPQMDRTTAYPIGAPLDGVKALLMGADGAEITQSGVAGELCLGGPQVMAGYLADPEETARRIFVRDGQRFYRSGDQCTRDEDGLYHFVGRKDAEIKLNGRRINLAEVQAECMSLHGIKRAAVGLVEGPNGKPVIGVVLISNDPDASSRARDWLKARLPPYMLPGLWQVVGEHHIGSTGKTDDRSLLARFKTETDPAANDSSLILETAK